MNSKLDTSTVTYVVEQGRKSFVLSSCSPGPCLQKIGAILGTIYGEQSFFPPSISAVHFWIHKQSQNAIGNSAFGTEQKATYLMIKTLHLGNLSPNGNM